MVKLIESRGEEWGVRGCAPVGSQESHLRPETRNFLAIVCPTASMTPGYFHRKQKKIDWTNRIS